MQHRKGFVAQDETNDVNLDAGTAPLDDVEQDDLIASLTLKNEQDLVRAGRWNDAVVALAGLIYLLATIRPTTFLSPSSSFFGTRLLVMFCLGSLAPLLSEGSRSWLGGYVPSAIVSTVKDLVRGLGLGPITTRIGQITSMDPDTIAHLVLTSLPPLVSWIFTPRSSPATALFWSVPLVLGVFKLLREREERETLERLDHLKGLRYGLKGA